MKLRIETLQKIGQLVNTGCIVCMEWSELKKFEFILKRMGIRHTVRLAGLVYWEIVLKTAEEGIKKRAAM